MLHWCGEITLEIQFQVTSTFLREVLLSLIGNTKAENQPNEIRFESDGVVYNLMQGICEM